MTKADTNKKLDTLANMSAPTVRRYIARVWKGEDCTAYGLPTLEEIVKRRPEYEYELRKADATLAFIKGEFNRVMASGDYGEKCQPWVKRINRVERDQKTARDRVSVVEYVAFAMQQEARLARSEIREKEAAKLSAAPNLPQRANVAHAYAPFPQAPGLHTVNYDLPTAHYEETVQ